MGMSSINPPVLCRSRFRGPQAFTLVEVVFAGCLLAVLVSSSVVAMTQVNRWATGARLRTLALAVAQQRIDQAQTAPWQLSGTRPAILVAATTTENNLPLNNDAFNSATGLSSVFTALDTPVSAQRTTVAADITIRLVRISVTVTYTYRDRPVSVSLSTLRTSDSI